MREKSSFTQKFLSQARKLFHHGNWHQLIYDIGLVLYGEFFLYTLVADGSWLHRSFGIPHLVAASVGVSLLMMWYLGMVVHRYVTAVKNKIILGIVFVYSLFILVTLPLFMAGNVGDLLPGDTETIAGVTGISILVIGCTYGFIFSFSEIVRRPGESILFPVIRNSRRISLFVFGYAASLVIIGGSVRLKPVLGRGTFFTALLLGGLVVGIPYYGLLLIEKRLMPKFVEKDKDGEYYDEEEKDYKYVRESRGYVLLKAFIFPLIFIPAVCLCEEIYLFGCINGAAKRGETLTSWGMLIHLLLTGVIPLRVLTALQPPVSKYHLATGILSIAYLISCSLKLLPQQGM